MVARRLRLLTTAALAGLIATLGVAPAPASAHAALKSVSPKDGAKVGPLPERVTFTFNEDIQGEFTNVKVTAGGEQVKVAEPQTDGEKVIQELPETMDPGTVTVAFRVVSADGHPITGDMSFTFSEGAPTPPPPSKSASPSEAPSEAPSAPAAVAPPLPGDPVSLEKNSNGMLWLWGVAGLVVVIVAGVLIAGRMRRRSEGP